MGSGKAKLGGLVLAAAVSAVPTAATRAQGLIPSLPSVPSGLGGLGGLGGLPSIPGAGVPAVPGVAVPGAAGVPGVPVAAAPRTLWSFLGLSKANLAVCRSQICASQMGSMLNNVMTPISGMTGGLLPNFCPTVPTAADADALAAAYGPTSPQAVAAKIQQDEAEAAARRAAVRYLSTVSCHYWPEAEAALIVALRDDRNECVRYEAALALLNGCCCTEKTIEALNIVVSGSEKDGKPSELSDRVKAASFGALQRCLLCYQPPAAAEVPHERPEPVPLERPGPIPLERPADPADGLPPALPVAPAAAAPGRRTAGRLAPAFRRVAYYYTTLPGRPPAQVVAEAEATVARLGGRPPASRTLRTGERTLYHALAKAADPPPAPPSPTAAAPDPAGAALAALTPPPRPARPPAPATDDPGVGLARAPRPAAAPAPSPPTTTTGRRPAARSPATGRRSLRDIFLDSLSPPRGG